MEKARYKFLIINFLFFLIIVMCVANKLAKPISVPSKKVVKTAAVNLFPQASWFGSWNLLFRQFGQFHLQGVFFFFFLQELGFLCWE